MNNTINTEVDISEPTHKIELAEYQELIYKLGYTPRPTDEQ